MTRARAKTRALMSAALVASFTFCAAAPAMAASVNYSFTQGVQDNFDRSDGPEAGTVSPGFATFLSNANRSLANFDSLRVNRDRVFSFDLSSIGGDLTSVVLNAWLRPTTNRLANNDALIVSAYDDAGNRILAAEGFRIGRLNGENGLFDFNWRETNARPTPVGGYLATIDFSNFTSRRGAGRNIIGALDTVRRIDVRITDDTAIDFARLDVHATPAPIPLPAGAWLMLTALGALALRARKRTA
ncbi:MAG: VPLPA-CTERM sorting domain-containing protein [Pseudomonadota bacterium]